MPTHNLMSRAHARVDMSGAASAASPRASTSHHARESAPTEDLSSIKERIKDRLASGETCTLAECKDFVASILAASEAQATEDLELIEALAAQVADEAAEEVLTALTRAAPAFNTDTRELIDSILIAGERDGEREPTGAMAGNTGVAFERAVRKANQRVLDLIDIVSVCRAERVKLLAELVTASRDRGMASGAQFQRLTERTQR